MSGLSDIQIDVFRQRLLEQKQKLLAAVLSASEAADVVELDQTRQGRLSRMDALQAQAMSKAIQERRQLQIKQIGEALRRIEGHEYGYCRACDEEITCQRLEFNPAVIFCIKCAD